MRNNKSKETDMLPEYDFSKGVRGKYHKAYTESTNIVFLEPEVMKVFPNSESVNEALKLLMQIIKSHGSKRSRIKSK
jgi:hypothetical protein